MMAGAIAGTAMLGRLMLPIVWVRILIVPGVAARAATGLLGTQIFHRSLLVRSEARHPLPGANTFQPRTELKAIP